MAPVQSKPLSVVVVPRRASLPRKCKHTTPTASAHAMTTRAGAAPKKKIIPFFSDSTASESGPEDEQDPTLSKPGSYSDDSAPEGSVSCVPHSAPESVTSLENYEPWGECCYHINTDTCSMSQLKDAYSRLRWFYAHLNRNLDDYHVHQQQYEALIETLNYKIKSLQTTHRAAMTKLVNQHRKDLLIWNKIAHKYSKEEASMRILHAELQNQLTQEIRSHYPPAIESDIPIKQEQE